MPTYKQRPNGELTYCDKRKIKKCEFTTRYFQKKQNFSSQFMVTPTDDFTKNQTYLNFL